MAPPAQDAIVTTSIIIFLLGKSQPKPSFATGILGGGKQPKVYLWFVLISFLNDTKFYMHVVQFFFEFDSWTFLLEVSSFMILPRTNSSHLKMDGWKMSFLFGWRNLAGAMFLLVPGSVR